ncbi:MAG: TonB-dependent receptor domain-containing protein, partial [Gammaproteobacteria bacterium]
NQTATGSVAGGSTPLAQGETLYQGLEFYTRMDAAALFNLKHNVYFQAAWTWVADAEMKTPFQCVDAASCAATGGFVQGDTEGNRLPYAPEHLLTAAIGLVHPRGIDTQLELVYVSSQYADFLNLENGADHPDGPASVNALSGQFGVIDSYTILNFSITYSMWPGELDVYMAVKNLADKDYIVDRTRGILPGAERLVLGGLKYSF